MPPKKDLSIRLSADLREALDRAAAQSGETKTAIVERALGGYLGVTQGPTLADRVRVLELAVADLQRNAGQRPTPSQDNAGQRPTLSTPATVASAGSYQASPQKPHEKAPLPPRRKTAKAKTDDGNKPPGEGLYTGRALIAAGAPIEQHQALDGNRDKYMVAATGLKAAPWLEGQGWVLHKGRWYPPLGLEQE
jgi:hypothetical protein